MAIPRLLQAIIVLSLIPAGAYAAATATTLSHTPASMNLASLSISANGNATAIGSIDRADESIADRADITLPVSIPIGDIPEMRPIGEQSAANVSISGTVVQKNSSAVISYIISGSTLKIGETEYQVVNGTGIFNQHSLIVVLHATVQSGDWTGILILHGHAEAALSDPGTVSVSFDDPQSKLASKFFLELEGTLTLS